ncbi:MAG TPA: hypothetical protein VGL61_29620 [Kofleriaceae bacterium]
MRPIFFMLVVAACGSPAPPWQLAHESIIAVRATPPHIVSGEQSTIDVLVGHIGSGVEVEAPGSAAVLSPTSLAHILSGATITAPGGTELDQVRGDLGLGSSDPVPVEIQIDADGFQVMKTVYVGDSADNPLLENLLVNGAAPPTDPTQTIVVPGDVDVQLTGSNDDSIERINWLTSCGTMNNYNQTTATLHVSPTDTQDGQLAIVVRDQNAGVVWQYWSIAAQ